MTSLSFKLSDFVEKFFYLNNQPFSLADYPHMRVIYDIDPPELILHTSRQVSKSVTLANVTLAKMVIMPQTEKYFSGGFKALFVAPTVEQVRVFSRDRISPVIEQTPLIKRWFMNSVVVQNVFQKKFINGSTIYLRYGSTTPDRIRGISADQNLFDECQDLPDDNISIIQQTMARSMYKHTMYAGTPKRTIGSLASRWERSTKNEWFVKCDHCNKYNYLDESNMRPWGLCCRFCEKPLRPQNGMWVRTNPSSERSNKDDSYLFEGFRVSILMFAHAPWVDWQKDVWIPYQTKPRGIFANEWLGLAYDDGVSPVTEEEIRACCTGGPMRQEPDRYTKSYPSVMGIDWGPINSQNSKTVMSILQYHGDAIEVIYMKKFEGKESDYGFIHEEIPRQYVKWNTKLIGADAGLGDAANAEIRKRINNVSRLIAFQHLGNQKVSMTWNDRMQAYTLGRNKVMTEFFQRIKQRKIVFPDWVDFEPFARDILAVAIDYDEEKNKYKYVNSQPDDSLHSILYGHLTASLLRMSAH